jgi:hypothetical protein
MEVFELFEGVRNDPYGTLQRGEKLLARKGVDRWSILEAMSRATAAILADLGEHGDANLDEYGGNDARHFRAKAKELKAAIRALPAAEKKASRRQEYVKRFESMDEVAVVASIERDLLKKVKAGKKPLATFEMD